MMSDKEFYLTQRITFTQAIMFLLIPSFEESEEKIIYRRKETCLPETPKSDPNQCSQYRARSHNL